MTAQENGPTQDMLPRGTAVALAAHMQTVYTLTEVAAAVGRDKGRVSRISQRLSIGENHGRIKLFSQRDVARLRKFFSEARPGPAGGNGHKI